MKIIPSPLEGAVLLTPRVFTDERGYFFESYNRNVFHEAGITHEFVQDNMSLSAKGVLRGLHFQSAPFEQGKLVRVVSGAVLDVIVDIRPESSTYGKSYSVELNTENNYSLWIPPGFAHGFLALEDNTLFSYKCTQFYNKAAEKGIIWNDPTLDIDWGINNPIVSEKDKELMNFNDLKSVLL